MTEHMVHSANYIVEADKDEYAISNGVGNDPRLSTTYGEKTFGNMNSAQATVINQTHGQKIAVRSATNISKRPKKPKVMWSISLHNQFLRAIDQIAPEKVVPKKIHEIMNIPGLTRANVASHLQKYRIFLRNIAEMLVSTGKVTDKTLRSKFVAGLPDNIVRALRSKYSSSLIHHMVESSNERESQRMSALLNDATTIWQPLIANNGPRCQPSGSNFGRQSLNSCNSMSKYGSNGWIRESASPMLISKQNQPRINAGASGSFMKNGNGKLPPRYQEIVPPETRNVNPNSGLYVCCNNPGIMLNDDRELHGVSRDQYSGDTINIASENTLPSSKNNLSSRFKQASLNRPAIQIGGNKEFAAASSKLPNVDGHGTGYGKIVPANKAGTNSISNYSLSDYTLLQTENDRGLGKLNHNQASGTSFSSGCEKIMTSNIGNINPNFSYAYSNHVATQIQEAKEHDGVCHITSKGNGFNGGYEMMMPSYSNILNSNSTQACHNTVGLEINGITGHRVSHMHPGGNSFDRNFGMINEISGNNTASGTIQNGTSAILGVGGFTSQSQSSNRTNATSSLSQMVNLIRTGGNGQDTTSVLPQLTSNKYIGTGGLEGMNYATADLMDIDFAFDKQLGCVERCAINSGEIYYQNPNQQGFGQNITNVNRPNSIIPTGVDVRVNQHEIFNQNGSNQAQDSNAQMEKILSELRNGGTLDPSMKGTIKFGELCSTINQIPNEQCNREATNFEFHGIPQGEGKLSGSSCSVNQQLLDDDFIVSVLHPDDSQNP